MKQLWKTKPIESLITEVSAEDNNLKRTLSLWALVALGIGAIIGAGIFVITGKAAATNAGPAIVLSFIFSGVGCALAGLCYAEFAAMIPASGSSYTYSYATMGEFWAWFMGWTMVLEYMISTSTVAVGWSGYLASSLAEYGVHLPMWLASAPVDVNEAGHYYATGALINLPAVLIIGLVTWICYVGVSESSRINNVFVVIKLTVIVLFIVFGIAYINPDNWQPFIPENTGKFGEYGWTGIAQGAGVIFFAYIGFEAVSTAAQEARNPQRDMPRAILISLLICTTLYILVALIMTGIVPYKDLNVPAPVALAVDRAGDTLSWLKPAIKIGALAGLTSVILVMSMAQPRIFYAMGRDGLLPPVFAKTHPKYKTPHLNTLLTGTVTALIAGIFPIDILGELVSIGTLLAFTVVCISVIMLRRSHPHLKRPFRVPGMPYLPILGALICAYQMYALPNDTWIRLILWMLIGFAIYFAYGMRHSKLRDK